MYRDPPGRLAANRDVAGIAAESGDIALDPFERGDLVHDGIVGERAGRLLGCQSGVREEAEPSEAVVETDECDTLPRELAAVIHRWRAAAIDESAAIDPDKNRQLALRGFRGQPHVRIEAIFRRLHAKWRGIARKRHLHAV